MSHEIKRTENPSFVDGSHKNENGEWVDTIIEEVEHECTNCGAKWWSRSSNIFGTSWWTVGFPCHCDEHDDSNDN